MVFVSLPAGKAGIPIPARIRGKKGATHSNEQQLSQVFLANTCPDSFYPDRPLGMPDKLRAWPSLNNVG